MGLLYRDDPHYDDSVRQKGFLRYRQVISARFGQWWKINLLTLVGFVPLAAGIFYAIGVSSVLVLYPVSIIGGMIAGPFLAGMYDAVLRGLRDDHTPWKQCWVRSWRQNWKGGVLLGAVTGLLTGMYVFMAMLFWWADVPPGWGTIGIYLFGMLMIFVVNTLLWPQIVLFRQSAVIRMRNCLLFCVKYFWRVMGVGLLQIAYWGIMLLFAPWTLVLLPVTGVWYIVFVSQFLLYEQMDESFHIEELFDEED